jgi:hypothetical protein
MTGLEIITLSLGASHIVAGLAGWYVGHHGFKSAVNTLANLPTSVGEDVHHLKADVADLKSVVFAAPTPGPMTAPAPTPGPMTEPAPTPHA